MVSWRPWSAHAVKSLSPNGCPCCWAMARPWKWPKASLPKLDVFKDEAQQARFLELALLRLNEIREQLDAPIKSLQDEAAFQPEIMDTRGALLLLPEAERAELADEEVPSLAQVWALGFMFVVENWAEEWAAPRDKEAAQMLDAAMEFIVNLTEDDDGEPELNLYDEAGPASTSQDRLDAFGEAIWAVYDLRQLWRSMGPRVETIVKGDLPGRNDPAAAAAVRSSRSAAAPKRLSQPF